MVGSNLCVCRTYLAPVTDSGSMYLLFVAILTNSWEFLLENRDCGSQQSSKNPKKTKKSDGVTIYRGSLSPFFSVIVLSYWSSDIALPETCRFSLAWSLPSRPKGLRWIHRLLRRDQRKPVGAVFPQNIWSGPMYSCAPCRCLSKGELKSVWLGMVVALWKKLGSFRSFSTSKNWHFFGVF